MNFGICDSYIKRVNMDMDSGAHIVSHWTQVKVTRAMAEQMVPEVTNYKPARGYPRVRNWIDNNIQGRWASHIHLFYFEDPKDAAYFLLRWA
jgi:hypothetical protein